MCPSDPTESSAPSSSRRVRRALVRHPTPRGRRWLAFDEPVAHFVTFDLDAVRSTLAAAEAAARAGRWVVGMIAYDAAPAFDRALAARRDLTVPLVAFAAFDRARTSRGPAAGRFTIGAWESAVDAPTYQRDVADIRARIAAGDTYQVNYTTRLHTDFDGDPEAFFAGLCRAQRGDHLAYLDLGTAAVCSASPELFLRRRGDLVETRPMKGTRARHADPVSDRTRVDELVASEKDRAENTMIVDMARNDLGRIARVGSVATTRLHTVETYPTVHHLTSTVTASSAVDLAELLAATFPGASITGAPKVATSRIIAELETEPRGVYTGAVGTIAPGGDLELNIAIRTAWIDRSAGRATYGVGGGVVWDSEPEAEWREAHDKARILQRAAPPFRLLETMAWEPGTGAALLDRHLDRVAASAVHFGFDLDVDEIRRRVDDYAADSARVLRVLVGPDGAVELDDRPFPRSTAGGVTTVVLDTESVTDDEFLRHKTTRRDRYDEARARFPDADDVVLWTPAGLVTEATIANVVVEIGGERCTPPASVGLLPGTLRAELLDAGRIRERSISVTELVAAERVWLINSVRGWMPARLDTDQRGGATGAAPPGPDQTSIVRP